MNSSSFASLGRGKSRNPSKPVFSSRNRENKPFSRRGPRRSLCLNATPGGWAHHAPLRGTRRGGARASRHPHPRPRTASGSPRRSARPTRPRPLAPLPAALRAAPRCSHVAQPWPVRLRGSGLRACFPASPRAVSGSRRLPGCSPGGPVTPGSLPPGIPHAGTQPHC